MAVERCLIRHLTKWVVESSEANGESQQARGFPQKIPLPLRVAEVRNEAHMQITKHDSNRMVLEHGHTSGSSGNTTPFQIPMFVGMGSMTSRDKKPVR